MDKSAPKLEYKNYQDLKDKNVIPVVHTSVPGPGLDIDTAPAWVSGKKYHKKAVVSLEGHTYRSKTDGNLNTPSTSSADWTLVK